MLERLWRLLLGEEGFGRISAGAAMVIALGGGLGAYYVTQGGAPAGTAHLWVDNDATDDCVYYATPTDYATAAAANDTCTTMDEAYTVLAAQGAGVSCGKTILVKDVAYTDQNPSIFEQTNLSGCNPDVVIAGETGSTPSFDSIDLGTADGNNASDAPDDLVIRNLAVYESINGSGDLNNVTVDQFDGGAFWFAGAFNGVTISNSDWGPCNSLSGTDIGCNTQCIVWSAGNARITARRYRCCPARPAGRTAHADCTEPALSRDTGAPDP